MNEVICSSCFEVEDTTKRFIELPYVCPACVKRREDARYHSGVPCQSSLDSECDLYYATSPEFLHDLVTRTAGDIRDAHRSDVPDQFDADTEVINDLRMQLDQANKNVQILEEAVEDLENQITRARYSATYTVGYRVVAYGTDGPEDSCYDDGTGPMELFLNGVSLGKLNRVEPLIGEFDAWFLEIPDGAR
jgi:hypothetical protein